MNAATARACACTNPGTGLSAKFFLQFAKVGPKLERFSSYGFGIEATPCGACGAVITAFVRSFWYMGLLALVVCEKLPISLYAGRAYNGCREAGRP